MAYSYIKSIVMFLSSLLFDNILTYSATFSLNNDQTMSDESAVQTDAHVHMVRDGKCSISFPRTDAPQVFNLAKTKLSESKDAVEIFWNYPMHTLTIIIETGYTQEQQKYAIALDAESIASDVTNVYRILNGEEIEVKADAGKYMLESDSNGQVVVKLRSWPRMTKYGTFIRYKIIRQ